MYRKINDASGFTILELLVSIVIFVVILMAMAGFSTLLIRTNGANEVRNAAVKTALDKMHQADLLPFTSSPTSSTHGSFQIRDSSVPYQVLFSTSLSSSANMKKINETISYKYRNKPISYKLSSIVVK